MNNWKYEGWESFWEPKEGDFPEAVLLTTYTFSPDFLEKELLTTLFGLPSEETGSPSWLEGLATNLEESPVYVFCDAGKQAVSHGRTSLFQQLGGIVCPVSVSKGCMHAKLWMIKFKKTIRIAIGSCNLTENGFNHQRQYIWMTEMEQSSDGFADNGEKLIEFMKCFTSSEYCFADQKTQDFLKNWYDWIKRARWPEKTWLIPCFLGKQGESSGIGLLSELTNGGAGIKLRKNKKDYKAYLQVFCMGQMEKEWVRRFMDAMHSEYLCIFWPKKNESETSPRLRNMIMSEPTLSTLSAMEETEFLELEFTENPSLNLLPHGKLYGLWDNKNDYYRFVVVGSSNFTKPAWEPNLTSNDGGNFELNILLETKDDDFPVDGDENDDPWITENQKANRYEPAYYLEARQEKRKGKVSVTLYGINSKQKIDRIDFSVLSEDEECLIKKEIANPEVSPFLSIVLGVEGHEPQTVKAVICFSGGEKKSLKCSILITVDQNLRKHLPKDFDLEKFSHEKVLKRYGWRPGKNHRPGNYRVEWVEEGINVLGIIDRWEQKREQDERAETDAPKLLAALDYFKNQAKDPISYDLASGEMKCRLKETEKNHG